MRCEQPPRNLLIVNRLFHGFTMWAFMRLPWNCVTRATFLGLAFKLIEEAEKTWRRIRGTDKIAELLKGTVFKDGEPVPDNPPAEQRLAA